MTLLDWAIVLGLNLAVFGYGIFWSRKTTTTADWFLAERNLPFWIIGLSIFATCVDSGDYIALNGFTYGDGLAVFSNYWLGLTLGWIIAAFFVIPPMYRTGMFTNAEYLEARFGPAARITSALVQLQYRTNILANMAISFHLILTFVVGLSPGMAWLVVIGFAAAAALYSARGGLKTVALTDALLSAIMAGASLVFWIVMWQAAGGWDGAVAKLTAQGGAELPQRLLHIGIPKPGQPHPLIVISGWVIIAVGYSVVNHTESMKMFGARSLWDLKMSVLVAATITMIMMYFNGTLGILGRAVWPEPLQRPDEIYPLLVREFLGAGLKGIVVAGVVAAAISTYDGTASALSALFTRDIYARLIVRNKEDLHYLRVSGIATPIIVAASFAYIPFILRFENMVSFFLRITSVFVTPLMTVYLMGTFSRTHRRSGIVGLIVGSAYGIIAATGATQGTLPFWLTNTSVTYVWSVIFTAGSMLVTSLLLGRDPEKKLLHNEAEGWLRRSRENVPEVLPSPFLDRGHAIPFWAQPYLWGAVLIAFSGSLVFYFFW